MEIGDYLARVNILSIYPTILLAFGFLNLKKIDKNKVFAYFIKFAIISSFIGYLWFWYHIQKFQAGTQLSQLI